MEESGEHCLPQKGLEGVVGWEGASDGDGTGFQT